VADCCENGHERRAPYNIREFIEQLKNCQFLENESAVLM
jgi:hypothetical protein